MYMSGMTSTFFSLRIESPAGVMGPLAASAMIFAYKTVTNFHQMNYILENESKKRSF